MSFTEKLTISEVIERVKNLPDYGKNPLLIFPVGIDMKRLSPYLDSFIVLKPEEYKSDKKLKQLLFGIIMRMKFQKTVGGGIAFTDPYDPVDREALEKAVETLKVEEIPEFLEKKANITFATQSF
jgi:hypothetical protein